MTPARNLRPSLAGQQDILMGAPAPPPMEFAPMAIQQPEGGGGPDISPLAAALQQRLSQNASIGKRVNDAPMGPRKKAPLEALMEIAGASGGLA